MTQDEIIEMAGQVGIESNQYMIYEALAHTAFVCSIQELEAFAKLVAAKEREACAKLFDDRNTGTGFYEPHEPAEIIRARGEA